MTIFIIQNISSSRLHLLVKWGACSFGQLIGMTHSSKPCIYVLFLTKFHSHVELNLHPKNLCVIMGLLRTNTSSPIRKVLIKSPCPELEPSIISMTLGFVGPTSGALPTHQVPLIAA